MGAAWAFLGIPAGSVNPSNLKKAFKKKALELHPDKGGDAERFQLLQEMKDLLIIPSGKELEEMDKEAKDREREVQEAMKKEKEEKEKEKRKKDGEVTDEEKDPDDPGFSSDS